MNPNDVPTLRPPPPRVESKPPRPVFVRRAFYCAVVEVVFAAPADSRREP